jgi:NADH-quinone oxidoreductase subunit M
MWLFIIPIIAALSVFLLKPLSGRPLKIIAVLLSLIPLGMLIAKHDTLLGASVEYPWFPALNINFNLKIDGISLIFLYLSAIIIPISLLATRSKFLIHPHTFYGLVLFLEAFLIGFFTARDLAVFTVFWEAMLIPLYFIISIWGGPKRFSAALKFLIYMIAGSALMVAAVLGLYFLAGTFNMDALRPIANNAKYAEILFAVFMLAFAVKTPLFPFHAWLPDTYASASTSGTILLSAILSKAGIYGVLRIGMELFPRTLHEWSPLLLGLAIAGVLYAAFAAWMQKDYKRLIAYSSLSHVNFVLAGLFIMSQTAYEGAVLQAFNHGITIAALFLVAGWLENRLGTTSMDESSGVAKYFPQLCWLTLFFVVSSVAVPGTNNFVGEVLIFLGLFLQNGWLAFILGLSIIFSVVYMLRWMQKVYFGHPSQAKNNWKDIHWKELAIAAPLAALTLWIGFYPQPILNKIEPAVENIVTTSTTPSRQR